MKRPPIIRTKEEVKEKIALLEARKEVLVTVRLMCACVCVCVYRC